MMNRQIRRNDNKDERGSALVLTLGILSLVLIMGMSFAFSSRTSRQVAKVNADQVKANLHGESGLDYALGVMQDGFVEEDGGEKYPVLYPPTYKRPSTATAKEKRFVFSEHNMGFEVGTDKWAHQHIWSYMPAADDKIDNSTDEEYPDEGDTKDVKKDGFDTNKYKHSFYYTLMNELPQLRLQTLQHISTNSDSNKSSYDDAGTQDTVQDYLKKIGFHTIKSDDEIVGRVGFLVLEEGHKFDVNQMLTLRTETDNSKANIPFVEHGDDVERCADLYTTDWSEKDYYYNITGKFKPKMKIDEEDKNTTVRWGLHVQELYAGDSIFYDNLLDGAKHGTVTASIRWMSYDHLWKGLYNTSSLPTDISDIYKDESNNYYYKNRNFTKLTFFSAEEPEAWWYDKDAIEISRFDVTGYEWRETPAAPATPADYYKEDATTQEMHSKVKTDGDTSSPNGWEDISGDDDSIRTLAFVDNNGDKLAMDDSKLPIFSRKNSDYKVSYCIPGLADMKDKFDKSVALQVAANMVDYCDGGNYADVCPDTIRGRLLAASSYQP